MASTKEINNQIENAKSWEELAESVLPGLEKEKFGDRLFQLCEKYDKKPAELQLECSISKSMFYAILNNSRDPSKHSVIKLALTLKITKEEINELLKLSNHKELYPKKQEDAIILFGLKNGKDIYEIDELLRQYGSNLHLTEE